MPSPNSQIKTFNENKQPFECDVRNQKFSSENNLNANISNVRKTKRKECSQCDKKFSTNNNLKIHNQSKHSNSADLKCDFCDSTFKIKQYLQRHILTRHTDDLEPVECQICSKKFK